MLTISRFVLAVCFAGVVSTGYAADPRSVQQDFLDIERALDSITSPSEIVMRLKAAADDLKTHLAREYAEDHLLKDAEWAIRKSWELELRVRDHAQKLHAVATPELVGAARDAIRMLSTFREMLLEVLQKNKKASFANHAMAGPWQQLYVNPALGTIEEGWKLIPSGAIGLTRGLRPTSAAIARVADIDSRFSHLVLFYRNPQTGELFTIESNMEHGVRIHKIAEFAAKEKARFIVMVDRDRERAAKAAQWMYDDVTDRKRRRLPDRQYDFAMDFRNDEVYCSELARDAYAGIQSGYLPPTYLSVITQTNGCFLDQLGITGREVFAPGDMELDPQFQVIAEWMDPTHTPTARRHDAILTVFYEFLTVHNVVLNPDWRHKTLAAIAYYGRHWWPLNKVVAPNMDRKVLEVYVTFFALMRRVDGSLKAQDEAYFKAHGIHMSYPELEAAARQYASRVKGALGGCGTVLSYFRPAPPPKKANPKS